MLLFPEPCFGKHYMNVISGTNVTSVLGLEGEVHSSSVLVSVQCRAVLTACA